MKTLWAFVGVALGAAVTLIGALLTDQNGRRTAASAREAAKREERVQLQAEIQTKESLRRQSLETVAKVLELITVEGGYAPRARVTGAVATLVQLEGGPVSIRILGELWQSQHVTTSTATWLINRILLDPEADESDKTEACWILYTNAEQLIPSSASVDQNWNSWPDVLRDRWPEELPAGAKYTLVYLCLKVLLARERSYWVSDGDARAPLNYLFWALRDDGCRQTAASILGKLLAVEFFDQIKLELDGGMRTRILENESRGAFMPWHERLLTLLDEWHGPISPASMHVPEPSQLTTRVDDGSVASGEADGPVQP